MYTPDCGVRRLWYTMPSCREVSGYVVVRALSTAFALRGVEQPLGSGGDDDAAGSEAHGSPT